MCVALLIGRIEELLSYDLCVEISVQMYKWNENTTRPERQRHSNSSYGPGEHKLCAGSGAEPLAARRLCASFVTSI